MAKKQQTWVPADIDSDYEAQFDHLNTIDGNVHDYEYADLAPEPRRPQMQIVPAPARPLIKRIARPITQVEASIIQHAAAPIYIQTENALLAQEGAQEKTSGKDRSAALLIRLIPWAAVFGLMGVVVAVALLHFANADNVSAFIGAMLAFLGPTGYIYLQMDKQERYDSRHGVEHHKIDAAERLTYAKLSHEARLKQMALSAVLKQLEVNNDRYE